MKTKQPATSQKTPLRPRIKVWLEIDSQYAFGHGLSEMLGAVMRSGSIKQAARELGKSYRYVWGRIKAGEDALGMRLVETRVGGHGALRSALTPRAVTLVSAFVALRKRLQQVAAREFARQFAHHGDR